MIKTWLHDLRSGRINQAFGTYENDDGEFCAIGVLRNKLHSLVRTALGHEVYEEVIDMNDNKRMSFTEIADWIDKNVLATEI